MERFTTSAPAELLRKAKIEAVNRKVPLHQIITEALEMYFKKADGRKVK